MYRLMSAAITLYLQNVTTMYVYRLLNTQVFLWSHTVSLYRPGDLSHLSLVHGVKYKGVAHPLADPQFDPYPCVEDQHGRQGQEEQNYQDEGGIQLSV